MQRAAAGTIRLPIRFIYLCTTELWERFALHGVKSLLTLYLVHHVLVGNGGNAWGMAAVRSWLEGIWGPLGPSAFASQIYGFYAALTYLVLPLGGAMGDGRLGRRPAIVAGAVLVIAGMAGLTREWLLFPALGILILGAGLLKSNLAAQVGEVLPGHDACRSTPFGIYLAFLNVGVMLGPLVCGWLAQTDSWAWAFGAAGLAMLTGLVTYLVAPMTPAKKPQAAEAQTSSPTGLPHRVVALVILAVVLCFCAYEQVTNLFLVWISEHVRLQWGRFHIPAAWFAAADGIFTIVMVVVTMRLRCFARLREGDRLALGCAALMCGYGGLAVATWLRMTSIAVPLGVLAMLDLGIALVWPAGMAVVTAAAPRGLAGTMVGIFYLHGFFANLVVGTVGVLYDRMPVPAFWWLHAGIAMAALVCAVCIRLPVNRGARAH